MKSFRLGFYAGTRPFQKFDEQREKPGLRLLYWRDFLKNVAKVCFFDAKNVVKFGCFYWKNVAK